MALTYSEAQTVSDSYYDKPLVQQVYQSCPFYVRLKNRNLVKIGGGLDIRFPIRYAELGKSDAVDPLAEVTFEGVDTRTTGKLDWKTYITKGLIDWKERLQNSGKTQIVSLIGDKTTEMKEDADSRFAKDLYVANPNGMGMIPITTIVDSSDVYAGVDPGDVATAWKSYFEDNTETELLLYGENSISEAMADCNFGQKHPNYFLTTLDLASKLESLIEPQKRYYDKESADAGFRTVTFNGIPVQGDYHCTAKLFLGLHTESFELVIHKDYNKKLTKWTELLQAGFPNALGRVMSSALNLVCKSRRPNFKFDALDYTV